MAGIPRQIQAQVLWDWLKWQVTPEERAQGERYLQPEGAPPMADADLRALAELAASAPEGERRELIEQLLDATKVTSPPKPVK